jgi:hypothetical protein
LEFVVPPTSTHQFSGFGDPIDESLTEPSR